MPSPRRGFAILCATTLFHFLAMGMYLAALPLYVTRELDGSRAAVGLAVGAFSISAVVSRPWVGRRVDRLGRKLFVLGAPVLIAATSAGLFFASVLLAVVGLRLVQGLAGSAFYTSAATVRPISRPPNGERITSPASACSSTADSPRVQRSRSG